jgi:excisionase family DNA binding protein
LGSFGKFLHIGMQDNAENCEPLLKKAHVCQRATISQRTLDYHLAKGHVPYIKLGGAIRFRAKDVDAWIDSCRIGGAKSKIPSSRRARTHANKNIQQKTDMG